MLSQVSLATGAWRLGQRHDECDEQDEQHGEGEADDGFADEVGGFGVHDGSMRWGGHGSKITRAAWVTKVTWMTPGALAA